MHERLHHVLLSLPHSATTNNHSATNLTGMRTHLYTREQTRSRSHVPINLNVHRDSLPPSPSGSLSLTQSLTLCHSTLSESYTQSMTENFPKISKFMHIARYCPDLSGFGTSRFDWQRPCPTERSSSKARHGVLPSTANSRLWFSTANAGFCLPWRRCRAHSPRQT